MKEVSIHEFQRYGARHMKQLPIVITKHGEAIAVVISIQDVPIILDKLKEEGILTK